MGFGSTRAKACGVLFSGFCGLVLVRVLGFPSVFGFCGFFIFFLSSIFFCFGVLFVYFMYLYGHFHAFYKISIITYKKNLLWNFFLNNVWSRVGYAQTGGGAFGVLERKVLLE
jgi:small-conductance mechanosensitive channel